MWLRIARDINKLWLLSCTLFTCIDHAPLLHSTSPLLHHSLLSHSTMATSSEQLCQGLNCSKPAALQCPTCLKLGIPNSFFCSQSCFKDNWVRTLHKPGSIQPSYPQDINLAFTSVLISASISHHLLNSPGHPQGYSQDCHHGQWPRWRYRALSNHICNNRFRRTRRES